MTFIIKYILLALCIFLFNVKSVHTQSTSLVESSITPTHAVESTSTNAVEPSATVPSTTNTEVTGTVEPSQTTVGIPVPATIMSSESDSTALNPDPSDSATPTMTMNQSVTSSTAMNMTSISISTATETMTSILPSSSVGPISPPPNNVGGPNNEYTVISSPKNFSEAKMECAASGQELVTIENLLNNADVNVVCLNFNG